MPTLVTARPYRPVPTDPPRKRWTRSECVALEASGFWDRQRLELVDGELISKMGKKRPHGARAGIVEYWVVDVAARRLIVHRDPREGLDRSVTVYSDQETVSPLAAPHSHFQVEDAFGD